MSSSGASGPPSWERALPRSRRLAELGVRRVSFAGILQNQLYGSHEAKLSEIAAEAAAVA